MRGGEERAEPGSELGKSNLIYLDPFTPRRGDRRQKRRVKGQLGWVGLVWGGLNRFSRYPDRAQPRVGVCMYVCVLS